MQLNRSSVSNSPPLKKGEIGGFDFFTALGDQGGFFERNKVKKQSKTEDGTSPSSIDDP